MIRTIINFFKYQKVLRDIYDNTEFINSLSTSLGVTFKRDRINRLYTVVNPNIQNIENREYINNVDNRVIYDEDGVMIIERWLMNNLIIIDTILKDKCMFDLLTYDIYKIDDDENYAIILSNALLKTFIKYCKISAIALIITIITSIIFISLC